MSNNASGLLTASDRGRRIATVIADGRHLELVTEGWIAELADLAVLRQRRAAADRTICVGPANRRSRPAAGLGHRACLDGGSCIASTWRRH